MLRGGKQSRNKCIISWYIQHRKSKEFSGGCSARLGGKVPLRVDLMGPTVILPHQGGFSRGLQGKVVT